MTVTYEDLQGEAFLRRALRKVLQLWAGQSEYLTSEALAKGAEAAVNAVSFACIIFFCLIVLHFFPCTLVF
jgi:hypothetical protein